jgi:hypothetical protein
MKKKNRFNLEKCLLYIFCCGLVPLVYLIPAIIYKVIPLYFAAIFIFIFGYIMCKSATEYYE